MEPTETNDGVDGNGGPCPGCHSLTDDSGWCDACKAQGGRYARYLEATLKTAMGALAATAGERNTALSTLEKITSIVRDAFHHEALDAEKARARTALTRAEIVLQAQDETLATLEKVAILVKDVLHHENCEAMWLNQPQHSCTCPVGPLRVFLGLPEVDTLPNYETGAPRHRQGSGTTIYTHPCRSPGIQLTEEYWAELEDAGDQDDGNAVVEQRQCPCGSTLGRRFCRACGTEVPGEAVTCHGCKGEL